ncbi:MAG: glycerophosphodiester phosphodiesterase [Betaproteobacteria bacterium]|nr:glycerophosphodiester phosphodiesterase [Betaproteobacteria bacterium]
MRRLLAAALVALALPALGFDLQGHRGARALLPENTIPSFELALKLGVTTLEMDIAITSDGVLAVHHDRALNLDITRDAAGRFLEARGPAINSLTWAQLQTFDVGRIKPGTDYARTFSEQKPMDGTRIPRLSDVFELVKRMGDQQVRFAIETKLDPGHPGETLPPEPFARAVVDEIRKAGMASRSQILSFDWRTLQVVQKIAPEIQTVYLTIQRRFDNIGAGSGGMSPWTAGFQYRDHGSVPRMIKAAGGGIWSVFFNDLDAASLREAKALGIKVLVWTVNDPSAMGQMLDMGVDGLITDRPDLARGLLEERKIRWR